MCKNCESTTGEEFSFEKIDNEKDNLYLEAVEILQTMDKSALKLSVAVLKDIINFKKTVQNNA